MKFNVYIFIFCLIPLAGCELHKEQWVVQTIQGKQPATADKVWLSHEHILVDFIGANHIQPENVNHQDVIDKVSPYLKALKEHKVDYFVDATPAYLGRDVRLLEKLSKIADITIITNTGFYGAIQKKYLPPMVENLTAEALAQQWTAEYENGIDGTSIKPGFIKIGIDTADPLHPLDAKLVKAAGLTHLKTGLTIASHTGPAQGLWPQLNTLKTMGVPLKSFIWVHAQFEEDNTSYLKAAKLGCWISLDGLGWELDKHIEKLVFAKKHGILDHILISHDAGWYDPQKQVQDIKPYTNIFTQFWPALKARGFTEDEFNLLIRQNPRDAFALSVK